MESAAMAEEKNGAMGAAIVKLYKPHEICGPVDYLTANYIVYRLMVAVNDPDAEKFKELLLRECEL